MAQNHTFWWSNVSKLGQNVVCNYLLCWNPSNQEKVSGNTVLWFFPFFWSAVNLAGVANSKCQFCTRFWMLDANPEDWDHKKIMLNGETHLKVSKHFFRAKKRRWPILTQVCFRPSKWLNDRITLERMTFFWFLCFFGIIGRY